MEERVLCIPAAHFAAVGSFRGFRPADELYRRKLLDPAIYTFQPRSAVETDPSYKQLIPYVVLTCGDQVFHYCRGAKGTEKRLHSLRSIGIGGHIAESDTAGSGDPYRAGMLREVEEEAAISTRYTEHAVGFIFDDSTPVGSVHLGVVHRFELAEPLAFAREETLDGSGWARISELLQELDLFETWSQLALTELSR